MKILLVAHTFPRGADDFAGRFLLDLARGQQGLGHDVLVIAPHAPGLPLEGRVDGVTVHRFRYGDDAAETLAYAGTMHEQVLRSWRARWRMLRFIVAMRRAVGTATRAFSPDVVHVHWWFPGGLAVWGGRPGHPPYVLTSHGTDLFLLDRFPAAARLARAIFGRAAAVTVIASPLVRRVIALGVPAQRVTVVPMPTVAGAEGPVRALSQGTVLFVGRLVERKGAAYAIEALALLVRRGRDVVLTIVGDGPERPALEQRVAAAGLGERVRFLGTLPPSAVHEWYARSAAFVLPAVTDWKGEQEGFGLVLVEALQHGLPVVATQSGGIGDIIVDGDTGLLVPERDAAALADALERILGDRPFAARLAAAGRARVADRFAPARLAATFESVYRRATAAPP